MSICLTGVHPYWIGDLDSIIMKSPELRNSYQQANSAVYGKRKSLSQQLEFGHTKTQVSLFYLCDITRKVSNQKPHNVIINFWDDLFKDVLIIVYIYWTQIYVAPTAELDL